MAIASIVAPFSLVLILLSGLIFVITARSPNRARAEKGLFTSIVIIEIAIVAMFTAFGMSYAERGYNPVGLLMLVFGLVSLLIIPFVVWRLLFRSDTPESRRESWWVLGILGVVVISFGTGAYLLLN